MQQLFRFSFLFLFLFVWLGAEKLPIRFQDHLDQETFKTAIERLEEAPETSAVILEISSRSADLEPLLLFARRLDLLKKEKGLRLVVYIDGQAVGPAALLPFLADELYVSPFVSWGDIPSGTESPPPTNLLRSQVGSFFDPETGADRAKLAEAMVDPKQAALLQKIGSKEERLILNKGQMRQLQLPHQVSSLSAFRQRFSTDAPVQVAEKVVSAQLFDKIKYSATGPNRFGYIAVDQRDAMISESTWLYVKTALDYYKENPPVAIILKLNTPGGQVFAAQKIGDALRQIDRDYGIPVIAFIDNWAISAGAMLAYSCRYIVAADDASMGAAAPIFATGAKPEEAPEKINSAIRADMRNRAGFYGRNQDIAAAMVDKDIILVKRFGRVISLSSEGEIRRGGVNSDEVISREGKLLTLAGKQLFDYGIADTLVVAGRLEPLTQEEIASGQYSGKKQQLFQQDFFRDIPEPVIDVYQMDWKGKFLALLTHPAVGSVLMLGMMLGFYMEMSTPGFGIAGSVALICLSLIMLASFALQALGILELLLIGIGAALIVADLLLIPTFGLLGVFGGVLFILGLFGLMIPGLESISYDVDTATVNAAGEAALERLGWLAGGVLASFAVIALLARYMSPDLAVLNRFVLQGEQEGYRSGPSPEELPAPGTEGVAATTLRPAGKVKIGNTLYDGTSSGRFIPKGTLVEVVDQEGSHIVVQRKEEEKKEEAS